MPTLNGIFHSKPPPLLWFNGIIHILNWLETAKKPFVKEGTYKDYIQTTKAYLLPKFENRALISIQYGELQAMITQMSDSGKNRTAKKIYQLLSALFEHAVADTQNPA